MLSWYFPLLGVGWKPKVTDVHTCQEIKKVLLCLLESLIVFSQGTLMVASRVGEAAVAGWALIYRYHAPVGMGGLSEG